MQRDSDRRGASAMREERERQLALLIIGPRAAQPVDRESAAER